MDNLGVEVLFNRREPVNIKDLEKNILGSKKDDDDIFGADMDDVFKIDHTVPPPELDFAAKSGKNNEMNSIFNKIDSMRGEVDGGFNDFGPTKRSPQFSAAAPPWEPKVDFGGRTNIGRDDRRGGDRFDRADRAADRQDRQDGGFDGGDPGIDWHNTRIKSATADEYKTRIADNVMKSINCDNSFDFNDETEEDKKVLLLEEIDILVDVLKSEEIDISRIKIPDICSTLKEISYVRHRLHLMNNRARSRIFAEESIMVATYLTEKFFDGKHEYFGYRPDVSGWTNTVNIKLRRMRYDTSNMVNKIISHHKLGPLTRIAMELIPSLILYSRTRKQSSKDTLALSDNLNLAHERIREIDNLKNEN